MLCYRAANICISRYLHKYRYTWNTYRIQGIYKIVSHCELWVWEGCLVTELPPAELLVPQASVLSSLLSKVQKYPVELLLINTMDTNKIKIRHKYRTFPAKYLVPLRLCLFILDHPVLFTYDHGSHTVTCHMWWWPWSSPWWSSIIIYPTKDFHWPSISLCVRGGALLILGKGHCHTTISELERKCKIPKIQKYKFQNIKAVCLGGWCTFGIW